jgi:uncharacterized protein (TIGR02246 family)
MNSRRSDAGLAAGVTARRRLHGARPRLDRVDELDDFERRSRVDVAAVRQAIEQANAKQADALNRGDSTGLVANYADDAVLMFPGEPAWRGRNEIGANGVKLIRSAKFSDVKLNTVSVDVAGDYAIETGSFEWTVTPKGGKPMPDNGKYLTVWKKQADGSWKVYRDINNSDGPPPKS